MTPSPPKFAPRRPVLTVASFGLAAAFTAVWQFGALLERGIGWNSVLEYLFFVVNGGWILGVVGLWVWRRLRQLFQGGG
jgi:hypothetical protein